MSQSLTTEALSFTKPFGIAEKEILNHDVESFLTDLVSQFSERRDTLLAEREIWKQKWIMEYFLILFQNQIPL